MDTEKDKKSGSVSFSMLALPAGIYLCLCLLLSACGEPATQVPTLSPVPSITPAVQIPTRTPVPTFPIQPSPTPVCVNGLTFISDLTIPDLSIVSPGSLLDKQWLVQNSGSCNWDNRYRLRMITGDGMGSSPEQALFPARAGTQATLRIVFTAPSNRGEYISEWQAFDPMGVPFGDTFFIKIIVQ